MEIPPQHAGRFMVGGKPRWTMSHGSLGPVKDERGLLVSPCPGARLLFDAKRQRWDRVSDRVWVGADKAAQPADMQRDAGTVPGQWVTLGDGNDWLIPVASPLSPRCTLPAWHKMDNGQWVTEVKDAYRDLSLRAADLCATLRAEALRSGADARATLDDDALRTLLADCLAINYDVTIEELSALRVFSPTVYWSAIQVLVDWPAVLEMLTAEVEEVAQGRPPFAAPEAGESAAPGTSDLSPGVPA